MTRFSICIPNYNYATYIGRTIRSVVEQDVTDLEVVISDNASTDDSVAVIEAVDDSRVHVWVNDRNLGFAPNLDCAGRRATGELMIMLSSDDLVRPGALTAYDRLFSEIGDAAAVVSSTVDVIDPDDAVIGAIGPDPDIWGSAPVARSLSDAVGARVLELSGPDLLRRSLSLMRNPFNFAATAYPRPLYEKVGGYGGGRTINPDKWFHWRLLAETDVAYFVDEPLFAYRWHPANQKAIQAKQGSLKLLVDDYLSTFELDEATLTSVGLTRADVEQAFVEYDVARHGLATLARGNTTKARRIAHFGVAAYPEHSRRNPRLWGLRALVATGPLGSRVAAFLYDRSGRGSDLGE